MLDQAVSVLFDVLLVLFGLSIQFAGILSHMSVKQGRRVYPLEFVKLRPYKGYMMLAGAAVGYFLATAGSADPSALSFIAVGYAANDMIDKLSSITNHMTTKKGDVP